MAVYTEAIQKLYVAYFNRPADYEGLAHWERVLTNNNGNIDFVSSFFAQSNEYKDQVAGKSYFQIVNQIYNNLFNRDADIDGLNFWADKLRTGTFTVDQIVKVIADTASDAGADKDKTTFGNKVKAATAFTAELNTASEIIGYGNTAANNAAKVWLSTIGNDASYAAATAPAALAATVTSVTQTGTQAGGTVYTLTKGLDNFPGTSGSDTFIASIDANNAELNTLSSIDIINGGTGTDFLKIQHASGAVTLGNLSNVEIVQIDSAAAAGVTVNSTGTAGVTELAILKAAGVVNATAGTSTDIALNAKESDAGVSAADASISVPKLQHVINGGKNVNVTMTEMGNVSAANADTITVGGSTAATGNVVVNAAGKTYDAAVGDLTMGAIKVTGGTTITVNQTAATSSAAAATDTSASKVTQGAVDVITNASTTTVTVKQTADVAAKNGTAAAVGGVTETASVKFGALKNGDSITLNGLTFKANADLTGAEVAAAFQSLVKMSIPTTTPANGDTQSSGAYAKGTYSGAFNTAVWTSAAATGDTVLFTSASKNSNVTDLNDASLLTFTNTSTNSTAPTFTITQGVAATATGAVTGGQMGVATGVVKVDTTSAAALKTVTVDGYTATGSGMTGNGSTALETLNLLNGGAFSVAAAAETFALNLTAVGVEGTQAALDLNNAATKTLNVTSTGANYANLDLADATATTTLNVSGTGLLTATGSDLKNVTTIKVSGTAGLDLGATARATVTSVDTTGTTGATTIGINGTATYAGGAGVDKVTVTNADVAISKAISLGAGDDMLTLVGATIALPTANLSGGEGRDTIAMSAANAIALTANGDFAAKIDGFDVLSIDKATAAGTVNLSNLDDIKYVISANSNSVTGTATRATFSVTVANGATAGDIVSFDGVDVFTAGGNLTAAELVAQLAGRTYAGWTVTGFNGTTLTFASTATGAAAVAPTTNPFAFNDADNSGTPATFTVGSKVNGADAAAAAAALTINNLANGGTLELTATGAGAIVNIKDAGTGTADVLNIVAKATGLGNVTATNVETVNVEAAANSSLTVTGNSALTAINVTGKGALGLTLGSANIATVNASAATGALTLDLSAHNGVAVTATGGSAADVLTASRGANAHADVLIGGAGDDTLVAGSNGARLTGGAGNDLFVLSAGTKEANTYSIITDFQAGDLLQLKTGATALAAGTVNASTFAKLSASLNESTSVFSNFVDAAIAQSGADAVWFSFGGNSYVVIDNGTQGGSFENGVDAIIQLQGINTLENMSFNSTYGTIGLI